MYPSSSSIIYIQHHSCQKTDSDRIQNMFMKTLKHKTVNALMNCLHGALYLVYAGLEHVELYVSRCVLDGSVDDLHSPGLVSTMVVVLGQQKEGP